MTDRAPISAALVADDHGVTRFGLVQFLRAQLGVRCAFEAERFEDAIAILEQHEVALIVFDLGIPGLDSARDLQLIRQRWPKSRLVVLSGSQRKSDIMDALEAGVHGYIVKTESMDRLADRLDYVMGGEIYVPPCLAELATERVPDRPVAEAVPARLDDGRLSERQIQVLRGIVEGMTNKQIANDLGLAEGTVKMHVGTLFRVLGARTRSHAASLGRKLID